MPKGLKNLMKDPQNPVSTGFCGSAFVQNTNYAPTPFAFSLTPVPKKEDKDGARKSNYRVFDR